MSEGEHQPTAIDRRGRRTPIAALAAPWRERHFLLPAYDRLLAALGDRARFNVVPLREFQGAATDRVVIGLRHDVDVWLSNAINMARLEHDHGLRATYFILHTAAYYGSLAPGRAEHHGAVLPRLRELQDLGHEVGWHNDLVTLQYVLDIDPRDYLARELAWLRDAGLDVRGTASHGSPWCRPLGFHNNFFFSDLACAAPGIPNADAIGAPGRPRLIRGTLAEFSLDYEAYHLDDNHYFSDARFGAQGRRWHTDELDLYALHPGDKAIILTHPDHWDRSVAHKVIHTLAHGARRALTRRPG